MAWDFTFKGGISALTKGFTTFKVYIPDLPDIKETIIDIPKKPGLTRLSKDIKAKIIKVRGILEGSSYADLITKINAFSEFLFSESDEQLIFNTQTDRYYLAQKIKNEEINREAFLCDRLLEFKCNIPFAHAVTADDDTQAGVNVKGTTWNITNGGHFYAYPTITVTFNQIQSHIYIANNTISGCRFDISKGFAATDVLVLNSENLSITLNDIYSPAGFGDGGDGKMEYILLTKGVNQLEISTDDATIDVDVNVNFRKFYLS